MIISKNETSSIGLDDNFDEFDDIFTSSAAEDSFQHATLIATLAEKFHLTAFKKFQKEVIGAILEGRDTLVVYPTGSGKSLCFQFPPVYLNKKAIIISPTISLMQDQVHKLNMIGIPSTFLGSAQLDRSVEVDALKPDSKELLIFVTPEWMSKPSNKCKVQSLAKAKKLALIAIDEAHLFTEWKEFRGAFDDLARLKSEFPSTPITALTATVTPSVQEDITSILRSPVVKKTSMNRPNITLIAKELLPDKSVSYSMQFAKEAAEIVGSSSSIVYTDFIADIGPIVSGLAEFGVEAVGYHGEMDTTARHESYLKWKSGQVQIIVATRAFGMGIDKPDIQHVIRNGVPESMLSWAQELGRAGRDGNQASATILYRKADISHANPWVMHNVANRDLCKRILAGFSNSWKYVQSDLAGICKRRVLLDMFGEEETSANATGDCCDVCMTKKNGKYKFHNFKEELKILIDALDQVGCKGELKVSEWIRGSKIPWTEKFNKNCVSYGKHLGKSITFWRTFMRQCSVVDLVKYELKSMIKSNGLYAVNGVYYATPKGRDLVSSDDPVLLPSNREDKPGNRGSNVGASISGQSSSNSSTDRASDDSDFLVKKSRIGKGSNILNVVRKLLCEPENWLKATDKRDYQFPGVFSKPIQQHLYHTEDVSKHTQSCEDPHFLWKDLQLSKGQLNKDRLITVQINGKQEQLFYRSSPCSGVKMCPRDDCNYTVPIRDKRNCPKHDTALYKTCNCPVEFVYLYPKDMSDKRRWFGGVVRCQKNQSVSLHNHEIHGSCKMAQCVKEKISTAVSINPALKPSEIACGKGLGFIPSAMDDASIHSGKVTQEVRKALSKRG